jgi:hypothetical protein
VQSPGELVGRLRGPQLAEHVGAGRADELRLTQVPELVFIRVGSTVVSTVRVPFGFATVVESAVVSELTCTGLRVCSARETAAGRGSAGFKSAAPEYWPRFGGMRGRR